MSVPVTTERYQGRRRTALVCSVALTAVGVSYLVTSTPARASAFAWIPEVERVPGVLDAGWLLVAAGVVLLYSVCRPRAGLPFAIAGGVLLAWSLCFLVAWGFDLADGRASTQWVSAISYGVWAMLIGDESDRTIT